jgi:membrane fusion protein
MTLFRREALDHQADRIYGEVQIVLPGSWQLIGYLLLGTLVAGGTFLALASYARVETVSGAIVPDGGIVTIVSTRAGIITTVPVDNGYKVTQNSPLVSINAEEFGLSGVSSQQQIVDAVAHREAIGATQSAAVRAAAAAEKSRDEEQIRGLKQEIISVGEQIALQINLVASSERDANRARELADRGFLSRQDLQSREEALTVRRQQLSNLEQQKIAKSAALAETQRDIQKTDEDLKARLASLDASRVELAQTLINTQASRAYSLVAPFDGRVAALTAHVGQAIGINQPLMVIVPEKASLHAELYVSSSSIGFIAPGQTIHIAIDAFPYQRFGTLTARIVKVSTAPMIKTDADGAMKSIYLVVAELLTPSVLAFGLPQPLLPGMTLSARIVIQRQSLIKWLFEPLFAVQRR